MSRIHWIVIFFLCVFVSSCLSQHHQHVTNISYGEYILPPYWSSDSILPFPKAEIIDSSISPVLDTIINLNFQSKHHQHGEKSWFNITEEHLYDTTLINIYSEQYDGLMLNELSNQVCYGVFYYKGFLFIRRKMGSENSIFFQMTQSVINVQHYYSNAKIYECTCKGERYPDPEKCIVKSVFVGGKLSQLHCQTYCPNKSWTILFDAK